MPSATENKFPQQNWAVVREVAVGITATLIFFMAVVFIPMMGLFAGVFTSLPTLLSLCRWGLPLGLWVPGGALISGWLLFSYLDMVQIVPYLLEMLVLGLILGTGMRRDWSLEKTVGLASLVVFLGGAVIFWLNLGADVGGIFKGLEEGLQKATSATLEQYVGISPETRMLEESIKSAIPMIVRILPGASMASALLTAWLNLLVAKRFCMIRGLPLPAWGPWARWRAPELLVWIVILSGFALLLPVQQLQIIAMNALVVLGTIYLLQGLAIITFYFERWRLPRILQAIFYGFLVLQQFASLGAVLLGFFDIWFDFRRLSKKAAPSA